METTVRVHMNDAPVHGHNSRDAEFVAHERHIDPEGIHEVWGPDRGLRDAYDDIFGEALAEYNAGQKRKDRRMSMDDYMESVLADTRGRRKTKRKDGKRVPDDGAKKGKKLSYELVLSVGSTEKERDSNGRVVYDEDGYEMHPWAVPYEVNHEVCRRYYDSFEERNPHMRIVRADWHGDEHYTNGLGIKEWGTAHLHLEFVGVADGYARGLSVQSAIGRALAQQGYADGKDGDGRWVCAYEVWQDAERAYMEQLTREVYAEYCAEHPGYDTGNGVTFAHPYHDREAEPLSMPGYQEQQRLAGELEALAYDLDEARCAYDSLQAANAGMKAGRDQLLKDAEYVDAVVSTTEFDCKHYEKRAREMYDDARACLGKARSLSDWRPDALMEDCMRKRFANVKRPDGTPVRVSYWDVIQSDMARATQERERQLQEVRRQQDAQRQRQEVAAREREASMARMARKASDLQRRYGTQDGYGLGL